MSVQQEICALIPQNDQVFALSWVYHTIDGVHTERLFPGITKYHNEMHGIKMDNIKAGLEIAKCVGVAVIAAYAITTFVPQFMSKN